MKKDDVDHYPYILIIVIYYHPSICSKFLLRKKARICIMCPGTTVKLAEAETETN